MRFENKVCLVTGGASGIGKATCEKLHAEGAKVAILDINVEAGEGFAAALNVQSPKGTPERAFFLKTDIGQSAEIANAIQTVVRKWGEIHVVVNNAALMKFAPVVELSEKDWDQVINVNLRSVFLFCKLALPHIKKGAIVNVSSVHAHETTANCSPYAASKGGIEAFTRALSRELDGVKVRVNCVAPGAVDTPMLWNNPNVKSGKEKVEGAIGKPVDLANAICFLASDDASFVHGTTLIADGGRLDIL